MTMQQLLSSKRTFNPFLFLLLQIISSYPFGWSQTTVILEKFMFDIMIFVPFFICEDRARGSVQLRETIAADVFLGH